jgi:hypothetical protein
MHIDLEYPSSCSFFGKIPYAFPFDCMNGVHSAQLTILHFLTATIMGKCSNWVSFHCVISLQFIVSFL